MQLEVKKCLHDVLAAVLDIHVYLSYLDYEHYAKNSMVQAAVERKFEIIGEALNRLVRLNESILSNMPHYKRIISF